MYDKSSDITFGRMEYGHCVWRSNLSNVLQFLRKKRDLVSGRNDRNHKNQNDCTKMQQQYPMYVLLQHAWMYSKYQIEHVERGKTYIA